MNMTQQAQTSQWRPSPSVNPTSRASIRRTLPLTQKKRKYGKSSPEENKSTSSLPYKKKRDSKAERQSHRKHALDVDSAKEIWNKLRVKKNDGDTIAKLCAELHSLLKGKCMELAMKHDASRCVQGVLQFGNEEQRREVVRELCDSRGSSGGKKLNDDKDNYNAGLAELCKSQYAHFVVLKMIKYCSRDEICVKLIVKSLKKQTTKLAVHSVGSRVVELLFATFPSKSITPLKLELYGPQYALFASTIPQFKDNITKTTSTTLPTLAKFIKNNPDKLEQTLSHLQTLLQKGIDKSLTGFTYLHSLMLDYASVASPNDIRSFLAPALAEHSLHLLSTRAGTKVVCECAAYATVKDRKKMIKCLKGYARSSLLHRDAYLAIIRMCDVMDDTVLVNKMLLAELTRNPNSELAVGDKEENGGETQSPILDLVLSDTGSKLFLLLLVSKEQKASSVRHAEGDKKSTLTTPRWQKYLDPYELSALHRNPMITENGAAVPTSKKEEETRRRELVVYLRDQLVEVCVKHAGEMMRSKPGSRVLIEVCESYPSEELFNAIVEACAEGAHEKKFGDANGSLLMLEDPVGHLTLKHMFLSESKKESDQYDLSFAHTFYSKFGNMMGDIALSNRGAFVLLALMQTGVKEKVKDVLKCHEKSIAKLTKGREDNKKQIGCQLLLNALKE